MNGSYLLRCAAASWRQGAARRRWAGLCCCGVQVAVACGACGACGWQAEPTRRACELPLGRRAQHSRQNYDAVRGDYCCQSHGCCALFTPAAIPPSLLPAAAFLSIRQGSPASLKPGDDRCPNILFVRAAAAGLRHLTSQLSTRCPLHADSPLPLPLPRSPHLPLSTLSDLLLLLSYPSADPAPTTFPPPLPQSPVSTCSQLPGFLCCTSTNH